MAELSNIQKEGALIAAVDKRPHPGLTGDKKRVVDTIQTLRAKETDEVDIVKNVRDTRNQSVPKLHEAIMVNIPDATDTTRVSLTKDADAMTTFLSKDLAELQRIDASKAGEVVKTVADVIGGLPNADTLFPPGATREVIAETLLKNPKLREKVRTVLAERTRESADLTAAFKQVEKDHEDAVHARDAKKREEERVRRQLAEVTRNVIDHEGPGGRAGPDGGEAYKKYVEAKDKMENTYGPGFTDSKQGEIENFDKSIQSIDETITQMKRRREDTTDMETERRRVNDLATQARRELAVAKGYQTIVDNFAETKGTLEAQEATLQDQHIQLGREVSDAEKAVVEKQATRELRKLNRDDQLEAFKKSLSVDGVFGEAAIQYFDEEYRANLSAQEADMDERTKTAEEKTLPEAMKKRWEQAVTGRRRAKDVVNKGQVERDYQRILNGEVAKVIEETLVQGGATLAEAQRLAADSEYVKNVTPDVVQRVMTYKVRTGKISESEAAVLYNQFGNVDNVDKAIGKNEEFQTALASLKDQGVIKGTGAAAIKEYIKENPAKAAGIAALIAALATGVLVPGLAASAVYAAFK